MTQRSKTLACAPCGEPVYWKLLEPIRKKSVLYIANAPVQYYKYRCPKCKGVTEFYPSVVRDSWIEENPGIKIAIKF